jgi:tetratricopeptide (TPR) repeat protein
MRFASQAPRALNARVNLMAARIAEAEGHSSTAMQFYDRVSTLDDADTRDAVERAAEIALRSGDAAVAVPRLRRLLELTENPAERARITLQLGLTESDAGLDAALTTLAHVVRSAEASAPELETALLRLSEFGEPSENRAQLSELAQEFTGEKHGRIVLARARSWASEGSWPEAAADSAIAVMLVPQSMAAIDAAVEFHRQSGGFAELAEAMTRALEKCPDAMTGPRAALLRALGDVQMNHLDQLEEALETFRLLRQLQPESISVLENLLSLYDQFDDIDPNEALEVASELVRLGALGEDLLRTLQHVHLTADNLDGVVQALQVLRLAGSANEKELQLLASMPARLPDFADGALSDALYRDYLCPPQLLASTASVIAAATEAWLAENPTAAGSGVYVSEASPVAVEFAALCKAFGLPSATLRMDADQTRAAKAIPAKPPMISISAELADETDAASIRFELARAMSLCRPEFVMLAGLSPLDALGFFEAALAPVSTQQVSTDASLQRVVQRWTTRLGPFAPPREVGRAAREQFGSVGDYRQAMETISIRSAVVASFESAGGFQRLLLELDEQPPRDVNALRELCDRHGSIRALVTWVLSDRYLQLRRELGLVIGRR